MACVHAAVDFLWGFLILVILFKIQNPADDQRFERLSVLGK